MAPVSSSNAAIAASVAASSGTVGEVDVVEGLALELRRSMVCGLGAGRFRARRLGARRLGGCAGRTGGDETGDERATGEGGDADARRTMRIPLIFEAWRSARRGRFNADSVSRFRPKESNSV